jgi:sporulation protein YlmC with PRC-barrel domain
MSPDGPLKLVSELLDLPIIDGEGCYCGIVDDVEFDGGPGKALKVKTLLVGPGAWSGRMPAWSMPLVRLLGGKRIVRIPFAEIVTIGAAVHISCRGSELGLGKGDRHAGRWIPRKGAL